MPRGFYAARALCCEGFTQKIRQRLRRGKIFVIMKKGFRKTGSGSLFYEKRCEAVSRSDSLPRFTWRCKNESAGMSPVSPGTAKMSQPERPRLAWRCKNESAGMSPVSPGAAKTSYFRTILLNWVE